MSEQTKNALEAAIAAHLSDEFNEPTLLTGYILQACGQTPEDVRWSIAYCSLEGQSNVVTQGLLAYARNSADRSAFGVADDD